MWNPPNDQSGQISARMETTPSLGSASISISQQQAPKKFAPVVAPKPKFNPFKQIGEGTQSDPAVDYPPPPPPPEELTGFPSSPGSFPLPPPPDNSFDYQVRGWSSGLQSHPTKLVFHFEPRPAAETFGPRMQLGASCKVAKGWMYRTSAGRYD
ncbi:PREDICTED: lipoma-preferred partner homolog [Cyprinodon variegatus]|uniref:lipoma-preferred partner homolog n=1 Tax=Cyprinodon variegatus TaxID=28743 RepID=UPI000742A907|nr:PREDICTED: lipoma-preferred partner homolog [Cyprinodon variegatus]